MHLGWWWGVWADGDSFPWVVTAQTLQFVKFLWNKPNQNRLCHIPIVHWWAPLALNIQWFNCSLSLSNPSLLSLLGVLVAQLLLANGIFILAQGSVVAFPFSIPSLHSSSLFIRFLSNPVLRVFAASKWLALMQPLKQIITKMRSKIQTKSWVTTFGETRLKRQNIGRAPKAPIHKRMRSSGVLQVFSSHATIRSKRRFIGCLVC